MAKRTAVEEKDAPKGKEVKATEIKRASAMLTIVGDGAGVYIGNAFPEKALDTIENKNTGKKGAGPKAIIDPEAEFKASLRLDDKGRVCFPGTGIKKALVEVAPEVDLYKKFVKGVLFITEALIPIEGSKVNMKRDRVGKGHIAYRGFCATPWKAQVPILYDAGRINLGQIVDLFNMAGFAVGLGAWRPACNGMFGMFHVE